MVMREDVRLRDFIYQSDKKKELFENNLQNANEHYTFLSLYNVVLTPHYFISFLTNSNTASPPSPAGLNVRGPYSKSIPCSPCRLDCIHPPSLFDASIIVILHDFGKLCERYQAVERPDIPPPKMVMLDVEGIGKKQVFTGDVEIDGACTTID